MGFFPLIFPNLQGNSLSQSPQYIFRTSQINQSLSEKKKKGFLSRSSIPVWISYLAKDIANGRKQLSDLLGPQHDAEGHHQRHLFQETQKVRSSSLGTSCNSPTVCSGPSSSFHSFRKYSLWAYYMTRAILGSGETIVKKIDTIPVTMFGFHINT